MRKLLNSIKSISETKALRLNMKKRLHAIIKNNIVKSKEMMNKSFEPPKF